MSQLPIWVQYVQALGPATVAVVAAGIAGYLAWQQWKTAHDRLRVDMYEKRFAAYMAVRELLNTIRRDGHAQIDDLGRFYEGIRGAEFLFNGKTREFINEIGVRALKAE